MDLRSGRRCIALGEKRRREEKRRPVRSNLPDHLSALPDDLLLLVLARLRCVATAARTSVLARRWRLLWTQLPALVFPDVSYGSVMKALDVLLDSPDAATREVSSLIDIRVTQATSNATALLRDAALFRPQELLFAVPLEAPYPQIDMPRFEHATSISLSIGNGKHQAELRVPAPGDGECMFPALMTLVLSGYYVKGGLAALIPHCPRLRVFRYAGRHKARDYWTSGEDYAITVHSATLRELVVEESAVIRRVDVATPMLNKLTLSCSCRDRGELTVSIVAPVAEKVEWSCYQSTLWNKGFGLWYLQMVSLMTPSSAPAPAAETRGRPWLLRINARPHRGGGIDWTADRFEKEVEKYLQLQVAADLSAMDLELHLASNGHVYGSFVSHLLGMSRVRATIRRLKLVLISPECYKGGWRCNACGHCEPAEWRSQTVSLTELEEMETNGFQGEDHEIDFLEVVSRCAPMLRRVILKLVKDAPNDPRIQGVFEANPSVECHVLSSDSLPLF